MNCCSMCGTGDVFCFGLMNNADLITDILDTEDFYNVISCVGVSDKSYNNNYNYNIYFVTLVFGDVKDLIS